MTDNTQELNEILRDNLTQDEYQYTDKPHRMKQAILDWQNKQIEEVLDRLEGSIDDGKLSHSMNVIKAAIEAERKRLKSASERLKALGFTAAEIESVEYFGDPPIKLKESK